jgi:hypothetical protein
MRGGRAMAPGALRHLQVSIDSGSIPAVRQFEEKDFEPLISRIRADTKKWGHLAHPRVSA